MQINTSIPTVPVAPAPVPAAKPAPPPPSPAGEPALKVNISPAAVHAASAASGDVDHDGDRK